MLTNLSNLSHSKPSIVPSAKFRSDLKNVLTKQFPTMQPFGVLQNRSSYKFPDIRKVTSVLESLFNKITRLMAYNFIKKQTPAQVFSCRYHKMFENGFLYGTLWWLLLKMVEQFLRISQLDKHFYRRIHKGERFVKMLCSK